MKRYCPIPECHSQKITKSGFFPRQCDGKKVQRFKCKTCEKKFSTATGSQNYRLQKRDFHSSFIFLMASNVSQNRAALYFNVSRSTIAHRLKLLGAKCERANAFHRSLMKNSLSRLQFDELITIEHTKCKPLSVGVAICKDTRWIIGTEVSKIPASGKLAKLALKKYGPRPNCREKGLQRLFEKMAPCLNTKAHIESDEYPTYARELAKALAKGLSEQLDDLDEEDEKLYQSLRYKRGKVKPEKEEFGKYRSFLWEFKSADEKRFNPLISYSYKQHKGDKACVAGQGELKKKVFDPLFSINHTLAMLRANVNRLIRRSWNTTKKISSLEHHLSIYQYVHNKILLKGNVPEAILSYWER